MKTSYKDFDNNIITEETTYNSYDNWLDINVSENNIESITISLAEIACGEYETIEEAEFNYHKWLRESIEENDLQFIPELSTELSSK